LGCFYKASSGEMPNFTRMLSSKFYAKISEYGTFKFKDFSRTFKDFLNPV